MTGPEATGRPGPVARARAWWRRWHRMVIPFAVVAVLLVITLVAHAAQHTDTGDPDYLNPASTAPIGGADLATRIRNAGVTVRTVTSGADALRLAGQGGVTVFVPAPEFLSADSLSGLAGLPSGTVVLVAPGDDALRDAAPALWVSGQRWATRTAAPGCALPAAQAAGPAGVDGVDYTAVDGPATRCYGGGLVELDAAPRVVVVGAGDPFRNDRIGESGNAALATALLTGFPTVVWLDLHRAEPQVQDTVAPVPTVTEPVEVRPSGQPSGQQSGPGGDDNQGGDQRSPLAALFPAWLWTVIGLVALVGLLLALAASRRLGPPVTEPLPVTARARESLDGRGRLYRQAHQPAAVLGVLRASALGHLPDLLGLPPSTPTGTLIDAVAAHTGRPRDEVEAILSTDVPENHGELVAAVERLDELMWQLHPGHPEGEPR